MPPEPVSVPATAASAVSSPRAPPLSPAAKKLKHLLQCKLPIQHEDEAIKDVLKTIRGCSKEELAGFGLQPPQLPTFSLASLAEHHPLASRLQAIQAFINSFQYNHSIGYNYDVRKKRPLSAILAAAAGILAQPLPIKCIEAVFLGILLTQGWTQLQRLPLGFKSRGSDGQVYRHIVLAVCDTTGSGAMYGALGISRCSQLMDKPLKYSSLAALVADYLAEYRHVQHEVLKVRVGLPVEHDVSWTGPVCWRFCTVNTQRRAWQDAAEMLNKYAAAAGDLQRQFREVAAAASSNNMCAGTRSTPQSPRGSKPHPHAAALRIRCTTPSPGETEAEQQQHQAPGLTSPPKQQHSPIACKSPSSIISPPRYAKSSPRGAARAAGASAALLRPTGSSISPRLRLLAVGDMHSSCECGTSDDDDDDESDSSDSEANSLLLMQQMQQVQLKHVLS